MSKAFRFYQHGGPDVLRFENVEVGAPGRGEVRLRNTAVAVNYRDVLVRSGIHAVKSFPSGIGLESAGVIDVIGPGVSGLAVGDRLSCVAGPDGAYAELRLVPAARVVPLPNGIDERTAAAMMVRGMTARYLLHETYPVRGGDTILIHAAAGGVGLIVCQWAKHLGATVIGTVGSDEKAELARTHGCHHPIVYTRQDFTAEVERITERRKLPVVYDSVGRDTFMKSLDCLRPRGLMVSFGNSSGPVDPFPTGILAQKGSLFLTRPTMYHYMATREELERAAAELFEVVASGKVKIEIGQRFPLKDAAEAHRQLETRKTTGSTVLTV